MRRFDKLKPGMFLVSTMGPRSWTLVRAQRGGAITIDDYWTGHSGHFYKTYNKNVKRYEWPDTTYRLGTIRDAQELIVMIFRSED